jgi:hypothetical protein
MNLERDQQVRRRADYRCEYCKLPQSAYRTRFQIDHVIAQQHKGRTILSNLALCCIRCNLRKGPNLTGIDPVTGRVVQLFNPRRQNWNANFRWDGAILIGRTPRGRATIEVLAINDPDFVAVRRQLMEEGSFAH